MTNVLHIGLDNTPNIGDQAITEVLGEIFKSDSSIDYILFPLNYSKYTEASKSGKSFSLKSRIRKIKWVKFCYELIVPFVRYKYYIELYKKLEGQDVIVIGGGNIVMDIDILFPLHLFIISKLARIRKVKCGLLVVGVGPVETKVGTFICKHFLKNCDFAILRDEKSNKLVNTLQPKLVTHVLPDPVFLRSKTLEIITPNTTKALICVFPYGDSRVSRIENVSAANGYIQLICQLYDQIYSAGFTNISILVSDRERDVAIAQKLNVHRDFHAIEIPKSVINLEHVIQNAGFVLSTRMHPAIIAAKLDVPFHCLAWQDKVIECFKVVDLLHKVTDIRFLDSYDNNLYKLVINNADFSASASLNVDVASYTKAMLAAILN